MRLDEGEKELFESIERGEWRSVKNLDKEIRAAREYVRGTFVKNQRMNIRITRKDLDALKVRALQEGIPYQTLVSRIIHKYLAGQIIEQ
jgi:predicted DNA binding CopG/RHH family protein